MRKLITYAGVFLVALIAASASTAATAEVRCSAHQAAKIELACGHRAYHHDASAARWIKHHIQIVLLASEKGRGHSLAFYQWRKRVDRRWIHQAKRRLYRPRVVHYSAPTGFPPHHALWVCIHNNEGPWNDHDGGYDGGLQMSQGWFKMFSGSAGVYSEAQQEWFAERAFAENHYSVSFLQQQWFNWDNADYCVKYA